MWTRRGWLALAFAALTAPALPLWAAPADSGMTVPLRELYGALEMVMKEGRDTPFPRRFDTVAPSVDRAFDLETVLKVSIGLKWDSFEDGDKARLLKVYRRFTIATYVANFDKYDGERFQIQPGYRASGADRIVSTEIIPEKGDPIRLDYIMNDAGGTWRVVDVLLDGSISRVAVQRSDFRKILTGGDVNTLVNSLTRKISDLSDGALSS